MQMIGLNISQQFLKMRNALGTLNNLLLWRKKMHSDYTSTCTHTHSHIDTHLGGYILHPFLVFNCIKLSFPVLNCYWYLGALPQCTFAWSCHPCHSVFRCSNAYYSYNLWGGLNWWEVSRSMQVWIHSGMHIDTPSIASVLGRRRKIVTGRSV